MWFVTSPLAHWGYTPQVYCTSFWKANKLRTSLTWYTFRYGCTLMGALDYPLWGLSWEFNKFITMPVYFDLLWWRYFHFLDKNMYYLVNWLSVRTKVQLVQRSYSRDTALGGCYELWRSFFALWIPLKFWIPWQLFFCMIFWLYAVVYTEVLASSRAQLDQRLVFHCWVNWWMLRKQWLGFYFT